MGIRGTRRLLFFSLTCALALPTMMYGQGGYTASIRGVVTDASSGAVPAAKVTVTDVARGTESTTETDVQGRYTVTQLPPSTYTLSVEAPGFQTYRRNPFDLQIQQQATIDVQLEIGEVTTIVEVTAAQPLLNTTIANLGQVVENRYILQLPLIGRNPMALSYLAPGVVSSGGRYREQNTNFIANGARNSSSDVLLDGVSITNVEQNSGITQLKFSPSVDAVQEFKVQTNFFSAEYGQTGGAIINMVTKSGSNDFHGTGYWFFRADELNANSTFANRSGQPKPDTRRHQFGGVVGGPIVRDKAFFFATYERTDDQSPITEFATFPTAEQRTGDFSALATASGDPIQLFNPNDTYTDGDGNFARRSFANNQIPQAMMDPVALAALEWFPMPNQPGAAFTNQDNFFAQGVNANITNQLDGKVDWMVSDKDRMSARYSKVWNNSNPDNLFGEGNLAHTWNRGPGAGRTHNVVGDFTRMQSPTTIITFRAGHLFQHGDRTHFGDFSPSQLGLPDYIDQNSAFLTFPEFGPEGYTDIGTQGWLIIGRDESVSQFSASVTKILGGHNLKIGGEMRDIRLDYLQPGYPSSRFTFRRQETAENNTQRTGQEGDGLASMLLGWGNGSDFHHDPWSFSRSQYYGFYLQDDWKITRKLTLNLGLRYDFDRPRWEQEDRYSYWDLEAESPINSQVPELDLRGVYKFVNVDGNPKSPFDGDYNNFAPRIGIAYALNEKTSIRMGYGLFYSLSRATVAGHLGSAFQTSSSVNWSNDSQQTRRITSLSDPWPEGLNLPPGRDLGPATFLGLGAGTVVRENQNPDYQSWNFSVQRQLPGDAVLEVNYTGSKGTHLLFAGDTDLQRIYPVYWGMGRSALDSQVPNPFHGVITDPRATNLNGETVQLRRLIVEHPQFSGASRGSGSEAGRGNSSYHSFQMRLEKRYSHGLSLLTHYTWSKMIDDVSHGAGNLNWLGGRTDVQDWFNLRNERSLSAHDVPHRFVLVSSYQLPVGSGRAVGSDWGRVANALLGGWEISGVLTLQSGVPTLVTQDGGSLLEGTQRPNLVGDPDPGLNLQEKIDRGQWFNVDAFSRPDQDVYGSAPRTLGYRSPHLRNLDFAIFKNFQVNERMRGEFRVEMDNATNVVTYRPLEGGNNRTFSGHSAFGRINEYASGRGPRNIQLGVKFYF